MGADPCWRLLVAVEGYLIEKYFAELSMVGSCAMTLVMNSLCMAPNAFVASIVAACSPCVVDILMWWMSASAPPCVPIAYWDVGLKYSCMRFLFWIMCAFSCILTWRKGMIRGLILYCSYGSLSGCVASLSSCMCSGCCCSVAGCSACGFCLLGCPIGMTLPPRRYGLMLLIHSGACCVGVSRSSCR